MKQRITADNYKKLEKVHRGAGVALTCLNGHDSIPGTKRCTTEGCEFAATQAPEPAAPERAGAQRIVTVCDKGINRSVTLASLLKWRGHDTISVGLDNNGPEILGLLWDWADVIVVTDETQGPRIPEQYHAKLLLFDVGPDTYPRPYNPELYARLKELLATAVRV